MIGGDACAQDRSYWGFFLPWANTTGRNYSDGGAADNLYFDTTQTPHAAIAPWTGRCQCVDQSPAYGAAECRGRDAESVVCDCGEGVPCGQFVFDHRNSSLLQWLLDEYVARLPDP